MPVPQQNSLFVEQASCLFLRMVQDVRFFQMHSTLLTIIFDSATNPAKFSAISLKFPPLKS
ncbi:MULTISPECIES: hypothetical protein [unclassified Microcoleus]|uniref:hypothetical protein n=1 Tax=unclassified Microcoleus TaxID=2642155 RepID=UPI002FCFFE8A